MIGTATLSECGTYRYRLTRTWDPGTSRMTWMMLNPSKADADTDDHTIRRCMGYARRWGYGGIIVVNLYALRATDPVELLHHPDPYGPENDRHVIQALSVATGAVTVAWGAHPAARPAVARYVEEFRRYGALCLGRTKAGAPRHPARLPDWVEREVWAP